MANLESYLVQGYDLSGGDTTFLSDNISAFTTYFVTFIWSNVTGTLDGSLLIRDTDDDILFNSLETVILDTSDETRSRPNINVKQNKLSIKFTANGVTGGKLSIKIKAVENILQAHESDASAHSAMRAEFIAGNVTITGDLLFSSNSSGLPYGEIFVNDNTTVTSVSSSGFTQFLHFDTNGHTNLTTPDHTNDHITITKAGVYMVDCCVNIKNSSGAAHDIEAVIAKNNGDTIFPNMRRHRTLGTGTDIGAIAICGHLGLSVDDTIELWISSDSASSRDVIAEDVVLMLTMVGGT